jgi:hypothetical protein
MAETPKRIHLTGSGRIEEGTAGGSITPGHLIQLNSSGNLVVHATAGGPAEKAFALEDALQGKEIGDAYSSGNRVSYVLAAPGDVVYAFLAAGQNAAVGSYLTSNGNGALKVASGTDTRLAVALEALDLTASGATTSRIRVRIL